MKVKETNYNKLELIAEKLYSNQKLSRFGSNLGRILINFFESVFKTNEPKVYESRDKLGNFFWTGYEPLLDRKMFFNSEAEVRAWLDRRHYQ